MNSIPYELTRIQKIEMETDAHRTAQEIMVEDPSMEKRTQDQNRTAGIQALGRFLIVKKN
jgi:hypothetical protein